MGILGHNGWLIPLALICASCDVTEQAGEDCRTLCGRLEACQLLPSALGIRTGEFLERENCEQRCVLTDDVVRSEVASCATNIQIDWCAERRSCRSFAACLEDRFPGQQTTGAARVSIVAEALNEAPRDQCAATAGAGGAGGAGGASDGAAFVAESAQAWCDKIGATRARTVVVDGNSTTFGVDDDCAALLTRPTPLMDVRPGLVSFGIEVRGILDLGPYRRAAREVVSNQLKGLDMNEQDQPSCLFIDGGRRLVPPSVATLTVPVPDHPMPASTPAECGGRAASCSDGEDNDGDGKTDCDDSDCVCGSAPIPDTQP
ncbi:MAG TPA: hypothetical protein VHP33_21920 [Polyangiaceae bacterium]|nr:hypothetical protein [Polyangiaceae bacterium]